MKSAKAPWSAEVGPVVSNTSGGSHCVKLLTCPNLPTQLANQTCSYHGVCTILEVVSGMAWIPTCCTRRTKSKFGFLNWRSSTNPSCASLSENRNGAPNSLFFLEIPTFSWRLSVIYRCGHILHTNSLLFCTFSVLISSTLPKSIHPLVALSVALCCGSCLLASSCSFSFSFSLSLSRDFECDLRMA